MVQFPTRTHQIQEGGIRSVTTPSDSPPTTTERLAERARAAPPARPRRAPVARNPHGHEDEDAPNDHDAPQGKEGAS